MIDVDNNHVDLGFFLHVLNVLKRARYVPEIEENRYDILNSFSSNQFESKSALVKSIKDLNLEFDNIAIFGSWYGSILIPLLPDKYVICFDQDHKTVSIGRKLFHDTPFECVNVLSKDMGLMINEFDLIINTSCEHMDSVKDWQYLDSIKSGMIFALQSNNMFNLDTHVNCVNSLDEFKNQLPTNFEILYTEEIPVKAWEEDNGIRYTIIARKL